MEDFERENRYIVLKAKDLKAANLDELEGMVLAQVMGKVERLRLKEGKRKREYAVVESDWPIYERTWREIEMMYYIDLLKAEVEALKQQRTPD